MKKADNFDSTKWLVENKITFQSRLNENFEEFDEEYSGMAARIIQHEYDHMNGTDYTDRVSKFKLDFAKKKFANKKKKIIKKYATKTLIEALNGNKNT